MRFTSPALLIAPLLAFIGTTAAVPSPVAQVGGAVNGVKDKIGHLVNARDLDALLVARAPVSGIVNADGVRYRRCTRTSCEAVGQYNKYQPIAIICRAQGESIFGWSWWDKMSNGFWISDYRVNWTGSVPDVC